LQRELRRYVANGGALFVSGAYVASDNWLSVNATKADRQFVKDVLKVEWRADRATQNGELETVYAPNNTTFEGEYRFVQHLNEEVYAVESPDAIVPVGQNAYTVMRYSQNNNSAAVAYLGKDYRVVVCGFPLESIYLMATPLHSQNYIDIDTGILTNNRRLVTKAMWANGTVISQQARRALENERVTIVSHATGYMHLLYKDATISPKVYDDFSSKLKEFLVPPKDAPDRRVVVPKLPDANRVNFLSDNAPLDITPEMEYNEVVQRLDALRATNRTAALAPYAARDLSNVESFPFIKAALERSPVSKNALQGIDEKDVINRISQFENESIYDGPSRLAQPDEVWNYSRGDGLEKCILLANALGGEEIRIENNEAILIKNGKSIFTSQTIKTPKEKVFSLG
jgi:hypothetical protein